MVKGINTIQLSIQDNGNWWILFFCLVLVHSGKAQRILCPSDYQTLIGKGLLALEAGGGAKDWKGYTGTVGMAYYLQSQKNFVRGQYHFPDKFIKANFYYVRDRLYGNDNTKLDHGAYTFDLTFGWHPFNIKNILYSTLLLGPSVTNDFLVTSSDPVSDETRTKLNTFTPGGVAAFELMAFFGHPRLAIVAHADQRFLAKDTFWGMKRQYFWIGLRYFFMDVKRVRH